MAPADSPARVTWLGSPPKAAIFLGFSAWGFDVRIKGFRV